MLRVSRTFNVSRQRLFEVWTSPDKLSQWWGVAEGYKTPIAEVDLRVGGTYRLGMQPPDSEDIHTVVGEFVEIDPPSRLVYTWGWDPDGQRMSDLEGDTLVTVEFNDMGGSTELVLTHERFPSEESRDQHSHGWDSMLDHLGTKLPSVV
jgi:uncharacterized protein YndB with AHSA1/START domain